MTLDNGRSKGRAVIAQVAQHAGVSITTVSHTLSGRRHVARATRERVLESIRELGYRPNQLARGLRTRQSLTVSLIIPDISNPFYPSVARGIQDVLKPHGYYTFLSNSDGEAASERLLIRDSIDRSVDGLIVAPFELAISDLGPLLNPSVPIVVIAPKAELPSNDPLQFDSVVTDDRHGVAEATRYLLRQGHRRIAFANGSGAPASERLAGFADTMRGAVGPFSEGLIVATAFTRQGGIDAARILLERQDRPSAIVCGNDLMAIGVLDVAREIGLAVPGDLAVIGFDDIDAAELASPALTTVVNPAYALGRSSAELLLSRLVGDYTGPAREVVVPTSFVIRASA
ncbi:MAG: LacI family DNA-binding transcriptional regulator [Candidatus Limnocylindrales bacterium]